MTASIGGLAAFWIWEGWHSRRPPTGRRGSHAAVNLALSLLNTVWLALLFGTVTVRFCEWAAERQWGLLRLWPLPSLAQWILAVLLLDFALYLWHRANHVMPLLWRFHRVHHADEAMDVTTATRFHPGEQLFSSLLRLGLSPLLGVSAGQILLHELLIVIVTQFHHANLDLGRADRWLRWLIVTPGMHGVHHSPDRAWTNSNYASVLSIWDRLCGTWTTPVVPSGEVTGLREFQSPRWQSLFGLLRMPWYNVPPSDTFSQPISTCEPVARKMDAGTITLEAGQHQTESDPPGGEEVKATHR